MNIGTHTLRVDRREEALDLDSWRTRRTRSRLYSKSGWVAGARVIHCIMQYCKVHFSTARVSLGQPWVSRLQRSSLPVDSVVHTNAAAISSTMAPCRTDRDKLICCRACATCTASTRRLYITRKNGVREARKLRSLDGHGPPRWGSRREACISHKI